jgi:hypothetical protein
MGILSKVQRRGKADAQTGRWDWPIDREKKDNNETKISNKDRGAIGHCEIRV